MLRMLRHRRETRVAGPHPARLFLWCRESATFAMPWEPDNTDSAPYVWGASVDVCRGVVLS
eukprot:4278469-Pyramimonas_sp.AAC.1